MAEEILRHAALHLAGGEDELAVLGELLLSPGRVSRLEAPGEPSATTA